MRTLHVTLAGLLVAGSAFYFGTAHPQPVRAQTGCNVGSLQGTYVYTSSGYYGLPQNLGLFSAAGKLTFNGDGTFTGVDTVSNSGQTQRNRVTSGNYTVGPDCRGTATYKIPSSAIVDFIVSSGGQTANFIEADAGTVISGTATLQILPPSQ